MKSDKEVDGVDFKIVNTIKIQAKVNGKKSTRRRFNFDVKLPLELADIIDTYYEDIVAEVKAELRTPKEWVTLIKRHTRVPQLQGWAASIIWWEYGKNDESVLYTLSHKYKPLLYKNNDSKRVIKILERMGCPKIIRGLASGSREAIRAKTMRDYKRANEPIKLELKKEVEK